MTTTEDVLYKENLRGKKYMMPVSPCFYTSTSLDLVCLVSRQDIADVKRPTTVEQELVFFQRVTVVRSVAASPGHHAGLCPNTHMYVLPSKPFLFQKVAIGDAA